MSEPKPLPRSYSGREVAAFRRFSFRLWGQKYEDGRGPAWFATGDWWPAELRRRASAARAEARALDTAAAALEREFAATAHLFAPTTGGRDDHGSEAGE